MVGKKTRTDDLFSSYQYDMNTNSFARRFDPSVEANEPSQAFTFDDYVKARPLLEREAERNGNTALKRALTNFADLKQYLMEHEAECNRSLDFCGLPPDLPNFNDLAGRKAMTLETWWGRPSVDVDFLKEIGPSGGYSMETLEEARLYAQLNSEDNAKILVRDPAGNMHLYLLDRVIYSTDLTQGEVQGLNWTPLYSTENDFELVEVYTSDGTTLESVVDEGRTDEGARLHFKLERTGDVDTERSNRIKLTRDYVERFRRHVSHIIASADTLEKVLRLQPQVLALTTPEQKVKLLKIIGMYPEHEAHITKKIIDIFESIPSSDGGEVDKVVAGLGHYHIYYLFLYMEGKDRMKFVETLASKGLTEGVPDGGWTDTFAQSLLLFGNSLEGFVDLVKHPGVLASVLWLPVSLFQVATGGSSKAGENIVIPASEKWVLGAAYIAGTTSKDHELAKSVGYGEEYVAETAGYLALETGFCLWGAKELARLIFKKLIGGMIRKLLKSPGALGLTAGVVGTTAVYNKLAEEDLNSMKDYENDLAFSIEAAYDKKASWYHQPFMWLRREVLGVPIKTMPQYTHFVGDNSVMGESEGRGVLAGLASLLDNPDAAEDLYYEGVKIFQEKFASKYFERLTAGLRRIYKETVDKKGDEETLRLRISSYVSDNAGLIALLEASLMQEIGISVVGPIDFDLLIPYLSGRE